MRAASPFIALVLALAAAAAAHGATGCTFTTQGQGGALATLVEAGAADGASSSGSSIGGSGGGSGSGSGGGVTGALEGWEDRADSQGPRAADRAAAPGASGLGSNISAVGVSSTATSCKGAPSSIVDTGYLRITSSSDGAFTIVVEVGVAVGCTFSATSSFGAASITPGQICSGAGKSLTLTAGSTFDLDGSGVATFTLNG